MMKEVLDFFDTDGIDIRKHLITFDSWYGSQNLIQILSHVGFVSILVHGKNNYVLTIENITRELSTHKKSIQLRKDQWGCGDKPVCRVQATSPTFGECPVLFFMDMGKGHSLLVFGKPLRTCEALKIWLQHHGIEPFRSTQFCRGLPHSTCLDRDNNTH